MQRRWLTLPWVLAGCGLGAGEGGRRLRPTPRIYPELTVAVGPRLGGAVTRRPLPCSPPATGSEAPADAAGGEPWLGPGEKVLLFNATLTLGYSIYGYSQWDWFSASLHADSEDWFGSNTKYGGADKLGHAYTAYAGGAALCRLYEYWGYDHETAVLLGVGTSWLHTTLIEIGDGVSREHGFSWEDLAFNTAGAGLQYLRQRFPAVRAIVDFRWEYWPSRTVLHGDHYDPLTDYSGSKWLLAFKAAGVVDDDSPLRFLELHAGFYSRGYSGADRRWYPEREQRFYVGLGLNLTELLGTVTRSEWRHVFDYYQVPCTYVPLAFEP